MQKHLFLQFNLFVYNSPPLCGEWEKNPVIPRLRQGASFTPILSILYLIK